MRYFQTGQFSTEILLHRFGCWSQHAHALLGKYLFLHVPYTINSVSLYTVSLLLVFVLGVNWAVLSADS